MKRLSPAALLAASALAVALGALYLARETAQALRENARVELAMSLRRQFDVDYRGDRAECARAFLYSSHTGKKRKKSLAEAPYDHVMDFFDTVGYLVEHHSLDEPLARYYFAFELDGYLAATQALLREDQKTRPSRYANAFRLAERWHDEDRGKPDLNAFFQEELDFADPAPEEGPRT